VAILRVFCLDENHRRTLLILEPFNQTSLLLNRWTKAYGKKVVVRCAECGGPFVVSLNDQSADNDEHRKDILMPSRTPPSIALGISGAIRKHGSTNHEKTELDVRPGGANLVVMRGPDGHGFPNRGVYLEIVENERLVFTDAYTKAWEPSEKPFMTVILTFENEDSKTKYTARVCHWTAADRETHENMGFY
jgi:hypothetical protein